jgi:hypothetical protein
MGETPKSKSQDSNELIRISLMLPQELVRDLKQLSLTKEHEGKYQVLIREVLVQYANRAKARKD